MAARRRGWGRRLDPELSQVQVVWAWVGRRSEWVPELWESNPDLGSDSDGRCHKYGAFEIQKDCHARAKDVDMLDVHMSSYAVVVSSSMVLSFPPPYHNRHRRSEDSMSEVFLLASVHHGPFLRDRPPSPMNGRAKATYA